MGCFLPFLVQVLHPSGFLQRTSVSVWWTTIFNWAHCSQRLCGNIDYKVPSAQSVPTSKYPLPFSPIHCHYCPWAAETDTAWKGCGHSEGSEGPDQNRESRGDQDVWNTENQGLEGGSSSQKNAHKRGPLISLEMPESMRPQTWRTKPAIFWIGIGVMVLRFWNIVIIIFICLQQLFRV